MKKQVDASSYTTSRGTTQYPAAPDIPPPAGIIILGGGEDGSMSAASGLPETNAAGERLSAGVALALAYPEAKLIFTGGSGKFLAGRTPGAVVAREYFLSLGIAPERLVLEGRARNTAENAALTREFVEDARIGPWVLVTSAFHMLRSRLAGYHTVPGGLPRNSRLRA